MTPDLLQLLDDAGGETAICAPTAQGGWKTLEFTDQHQSLTRWHGHPDIYLSVNPLHSWLVRERSPHGRGSKAYHELSAYRGAHCELDVGKAGYPPSREAALNFVASLPIQPSVINWSGGGLHGWWVFDNPIRLTPDDDNAWRYALDLEQRWKHHFCQQLVDAGHIQPNGLAGIDTGTFDLSRVLRLPGTIHGRRGNTVETIGGTGEPAQIHDWLADLPPLPPPARRSATVRDFDATGMCAKMRQLVGDAHSTLDHDGDRHGWLKDHSLAIVRAGDSGHTGTEPALRSITDRWVESVAVLGPREKRRETRVANREALSLIEGAQSIVAQTPTAEDGRRCCGPAPETHRDLVEREAIKERVRMEGRRRAADMVAESDPRLAESFASCENLADAKVLPIKFRIDKLLHDDGRALVVAAQKTGKTTMLVNLIATFTSNPFDNPKFLGKYDVDVIAGKVCVLSYEMPRNVMTEWLQQSGCDQARVITFHLRGLPNPLASDHGRRMLAARLAAEQVEILIIDTYSRAFVGCGDSENDANQANQWCAYVDQVAHAAGVKGVVVSHHTNQGGQAARGSTALPAWADTVWFIRRGTVGKAGASADDDEHSVRVFHAEGRGGDVVPEVLSYDEATRTVTASGMTHREWQMNAKAEQAWETVRDHFATTGLGQSQNKIAAALQAGGHGMRRDDIGPTLAKWESEGRIVSDRGGKFVLYYLAQP